MRNKFTLVFSLFLALVLTVSGLASAAPSGKPDPDNGQGKTYAAGDWVTCNPTNAGTLWYHFTGQVSPHSESSEKSGKFSFQLNADEARAMNQQGPASLRQGTENNICRAHADTTPPDAEEATVIASCVATGSNTNPFTLNRGKKPGMKTVEMTFQDWKDLQGTKTTDRVKYDSTVAGICGGGSTSVSISLSDVTETPIEGATATGTAIEFTSTPTLVPTNTIVPTDTPQPTPTPFPTIIVNTPNIPPAMSTVVVNGTTVVTNPGQGQSTPQDPAGQQWVTVCAFENGSKLVESVKKVNLANFLKKHPGYSEANCSKSAPAPSYP